jgi:hypothetical protein
MVIANFVAVTGRVNAAICLFDQMPYHETSIELTRAMFGKSGEMNVMEDDGDVVATEQIGGHSLRTSKHRRSSRMSRSTLPASSHEAKIHRELLKRQSRAYYKLGQLVRVVHLMWEWAEAEDDFIM